MKNNDFKLKTKGLPANFYFLKKEIKKKTSSVLKIATSEDYNGYFPLNNKIHKNISNIIIDE